MAKSSPSLRRRSLLTRRSAQVLDPSTSSPNIHKYGETLKPSHTATTQHQNSQLFLTGPTALTKMLKQKIVVKVSMEGAKGRCKALKTVAELPGIISTTLEDDRVVVVGNIDSVRLTVKLRKKMRFAELVSVAPAEEKKEEEEEDKSVQPVVWPYQCHAPMMQPVLVQHDNYDPYCSII